MGLRQLLDKQKGRGSRWGSAAWFFGAGGVAYVWRDLRADTAVLLSVVYCGNVAGFHARSTIRTPRGAPEIRVPTNECVTVVIGHLLQSGSWRTTGWDSPS
jgi:hypothetical protein